MVTLKALADAALAVYEAAYAADSSATYDATVEAVTADVACHSKRGRDALETFLLAALDAANIPEYHTVHCDCEADPYVCGERRVWEGGLLSVHMFPDSALQPRLTNWS